MKQTVSPACLSLPPAGTTAAIWQTFQQECRFVPRESSPEAAAWWEVTQASCPEAPCAIQLLHLLSQLGNAKSAQGKGDNGRKENTAGRANSDGPYRVVHHMRETENPHTEDTVIPVLQVRKLRLGEFEFLA